MQRALAILRSALNETCARVAREGAATGTHFASKTADGAKQDLLSVSDLRDAEQSALPKPDMRTQNEKTNSKV